MILNDNAHDQPPEDFESHGANTCGSLVVARHGVDTLLWEIAGKMTLHSEPVETFWSSTNSKHAYPKWWEHAMPLQAWQEVLKSSHYFWSIHTSCSRFCPLEIIGINIPGGLLLHGGVTTKWQWKCGRSCFEQQVQTTGPLSHQVNFWVIFLEKWLGCKIFTYL